VDPRRDLDPSVTNCHFFHNENRLHLAKIIPSPQDPIHQDLQQHLAVTKDYVAPDDDHVFLPDQPGSPARTLNSVKAIPPVAIPPEP